MFLTPESIQELAYTTYYVHCIKASLNAAFCIINFPSQTVERQNKPEVEVGTSPELLLNPVLICRNEIERFFIEPSINSVRISISWHKSDDTEQIIVRKFMRFLMNKAEFIKMLRKTPVEGYDISFLITSDEIEENFRDKLAGFFAEVMESIDRDIMSMKIDQNARSRSVVKKYMRDLSWPQEEVED